MKLLVACLILHYDVQPLASRPPNDQIGDVNSPPVREDLDQTEKRQFNVENRLLVVASITMYSVGVRSYRKIEIGKLISERMNVVTDRVTES